MASFLNLVLVMYIIKVYNIEREKERELTGWPREDGS
jgi:hypothetical protein